jgi:flagellar biosynthesis/type III secretory pathway M-ring protein FliF/YscJ
MAPAKILNNALEKAQSEINPYVAATLATITERLNESTKALEHVSLTVFGNGKTGIKDITEQNTRDIDQIIKTLQQMNEQRSEELKVRQHEADLREQERLTREDERADRQKDIRNWWIGVGIAIVTGLFTIIATVVGNIDVTKLIDATHHIATLTPTIIH